MDMSRPPPEVQAVAVVIVAVRRGQLEGMTSLVVGTVALADATAEQGAGGATSAPGGDAGATVTSLSDAEGAKT